MPEVITIIALCVNLIILILLTNIYNPYLYPEFYYIKIFLVFNSFFLAEFIYLIFSQYTVKTAFMYSFSSNYLICSLYYITIERLDKFRINPYDYDLCCPFEGYVVGDFKIYLENSKILECLFIYLSASALIKFMLFKIINIKNLKAKFLDFLVINVTFIIFYFSLSDCYLLLKKSIDTYYKYKLYSHKTYEFLIEEYCNENFNDNLAPIYNEKKKKFFIKPDNALSKILDIFVVEEKKE